MRQDTYDEKVASKYTKPAKFLQQLHLAGVPLVAIMTNDWDTTYHQRIYIYQGRKSRVYQRFSAYDLANAIRYYEGV
jgi:hypothetical protein